MSPHVVSLLPGHGTGSAWVCPLLPRWDKSENPPNSTSLTASWASGRVPEEELGAGARNPKGVSWLPGAVSSWTNGHEPSPAAIPQGILVLQPGLWVRSSQIKDPQRSSFGVGMNSPELGELGQSQGLGKGGEHHTQNWEWLFLGQFSAWRETKGIKRFNMGPVLNEEAENPQAGIAGKILRDGLWGLWRAQRGQGKGVIRGSRPLRGSLCTFPAWSWAGTTSHGRVTASLPQLGVGEKDVGNGLG